MSQPTKMDFESIYGATYEHQFKIQNCTLSKPDVVVAMAHLFLIGKKFKRVDSDGMVNNCLSVSLEKSSTLE